MDREILVNLGLKKYKMCKEEPKRFFIRSIVAGLYLGMATILSYTLGCLLFKDALVASKIAVAFSFGIGLVAICLLGAELFTGNCFTSIMPVLDKQLKLHQVFKMWIVCYIGNFIGVFIVCMLFVLSGVNEALMKEYMGTVMNAKMAIEPLPLFIRAILCNFIVCIASFAGTKLKSETAKVLVIIVVVAAFVLPGFEHSIANMGIFTVGFGSLQGAIGFDWLPLHMVLSTLGNIIGGSVLLGVPIYYMNVEKNRG